MTLTARTAAAALARAVFAWHRGEIDYRFESLERGREALEELKLLLRDARAAHDAAFRVLAESIASELLYQPFAPRVEIYVLPNSAGAMLGVWLRSPETLDLQEAVRDTAGNATADRVGRTTITVTRGSRVAVEVFHDADSTQAIVLRGGAAVWSAGTYVLTSEYHRNHGDEAGPGAHRYDRPVESAGTAPVESVAVTVHV